jgi:hypothetical protein
VDEIKTQQEMHFKQIESQQSNKITNENLLKSRESMVTTLQDQVATLINVNQKLTKEKAQLEFELSHQKIQVGFSIILECLENMPKREQWSILSN